MLILIQNIVTIIIKNKSGGINAVIVPATGDPVNRAQV